MGFFVQLCSSWQDFNWRSASRGLSATAELLTPSAVSADALRAGEISENVVDGFCAKIGKRGLSWYNFSKITAPLFPRFGDGGWIHRGMGTIVKVLKAFPKLGCGRHPIFGTPFLPREMKSMVHMLSYVCPSVHLSVTLVMCVKRPNMLACCVDINIGDSTDSIANAFSNAGRCQLDLRVAVPLWLYDETAMRRVMQGL